MRIVFIHGRDQGGKDPTKLQKKWEEAWKRGLSAAGLILPGIPEVSFPFYGDLLDELVKQSNVPLPSNIIARGSPTGAEQLQFMASIIDEIAQHQGVRAADIERHYRGVPRARGLQNQEWVQAILRALDKLPGTSAAAVEAFTRDVYVYLTLPAVRQQIDALVAKEIAKGTCVVVGHSLGSVVGYNVLRTLIPNPSVPIYVTVGSPLGVTAIKENIERPLAIPSGVAKWFNAMDERDVVALYPLDNLNFPVTPPIENKTDIRNRTSNRHGISGYLSDKGVACRIGEPLGATRALAQ